MEIEREIEIKMLRDGDSERGIERNRKRKREK